jgi:hypothetical protein
MLAKHLLETALLVTAAGAACGESDPGPPVEAAMVTWMDNGVRHSVRTPHAAVVVTDEMPPTRTFFITTISDGQVALKLSIHMRRDFTTGNYRCGTGAEVADMKYGLAGDKSILDLQECDMTVYRLGVNHGGVVYYTEGAFEGSIVVGDEHHDITEGTFSAPTIGPR